MLILAWFFVSLKWQIQTNYRLLIKVLCNLQCNYTNYRLSLLYCKIITAALGYRTLVILQRVWLKLNSTVTVAKYFEHAERLIVSALWQQCVRR